MKNSRVNTVTACIQNNMIVYCYKLGLWWATTRYVS